MTLPWRYEPGTNQLIPSPADKKDREQLSRALQSCRMVVHGVDEQVAAYEKLMDIYRAFDSRTTVYMGKKFKVIESSERKGCVCFVCVLEDCWFGWVVLWGGDLNDLVLNNDGGGGGV